MMYDGRTLRFVALAMCVAVLPLLPELASGGTEPNDSPPDPGHIRALERQVEQLERRLRNLEPATPETIVRLPSELELAKHAPASPLSIPDAIARGRPIPYRIVKQDPDFVRPVYLENWHSKFARWSYVPARVHTAMHRLFPTYDIGISAMYQLQGDLGVDFPTFHNETALDLYFIVFQTSVTGVYTHGNQVVVVGKPRRTGVQVVTATTRDIHPASRDELLLIQLATPEGDELDYAYEPYVPPDFWTKQLRED
ncbi:hypothetical protein MO973_12065 [Paenibacillus sp. TRM 82003]|nr:hypothetical protein [Paenibacillus sp. TRM 82003]